MALAVLPSVSLRGQDRVTPIGYGQTVSGQLVAPQVEALYAFAAQQGDIIAITMTRDSGTLDPFLILLDSGQQNVLAVDNDGGGDGNARIRFIIPTAGTYVIRATTAQDPARVNGAYTLTLSLSNPTPTQSASAGAPAATAFEQGATYRGDLNDATPFYIYRIKAQPAEALSLALDLSGSVTAGMYLYDATFLRRLAVAELGKPLDVVIPTAGTYFLMVARASTSGAGSFTLRSGTPGSGIKIEVGQTVRGTVSDSSPARTYSLQGKKGQAVKARVRRLSGDLVPYLYLVATDSGTKLAEGIGFGAMAELVATLPENGSYALVVTRDKQAAGKTTGDFALTLAEASTIADRPAVFARYSILNYGDTLRGSIDPNTYLVGFTFFAEAGDVMEARMEGADGLQPYMLLQDGDGDTITESDNTPDEIATLTYRVTQAGYYGILASRRELKAGRTSGRFALTLTLQLPGDTGADSFDAARLLIAGQSYQGDLSQQVAALHRFEAEPDMMVRLDVLSATDVITVLTDAAFQQIAVASGSLRQTPLPAAGTYYVLIARRNGPNDPAGSPYTVTLLGAKIPPTPKATEGPRILTYGQSVRGTITADAYAVRYVLNAKAGEEVQIRMDPATGSTLDPMVALLDPTGTLLILNDDSAPGIVNAMLIYTIPVDGQYTVAATRADESAGTTRGDFVLTAALYEPTPVPAATAGATPQQSDGGIQPVVYGSRLTGTIDASRVLHYFSFSGSAGDVVSIRMGRSGGDLDPLLYLYMYGPDGAPQPVAANDNQSESTTSAAIVSFTLPQTGTYLIVATRSGAARGTTAGGFVLTLVKES